jgi:hypothetical protein
MPGIGRAGFERNMSHNAPALGCSRVGLKANTNVRNDFVVVNGRFAAAQQARLDPDQLFGVRPRTSAA